jgi:hypothetical protein
VYDAAAVREGWRGREGASILHSVLGMAIQCGTKFGSALPQPFVCLAGARPTSHEFRVSVSDHCQHFGNCLGLAFAARRMDHCFASQPKSLAQHNE